jgi:hypothetical protein
MYWPALKCHTIERRVAVIIQSYAFGILRWRLLTTNFGDTGALSASAISCAFWVTLPPLVRTVLIASLKLFCRPCLAPGGGYTVPLIRWALLLLLGCHLDPSSMDILRSSRAGEDIELRNVASSWRVGMWSGAKAGNLDMPFAAVGDAPSSIFAYMLFHLLQDGHHFRSDV